MNTGTEQHIGSFRKPKEEWSRIPSEEGFRVLFEDRTERSGTNPLNDEKRAGTFLCAACLLPLLESPAKFDRGTSWPSFYPALPGRVDTRVDHKMILPSTENHCARCGGHQGHVFEDGPPPTGLRYCSNGVALRFVPSDETLPDLRT